MLDDVDKSIKPLCTLQSEDSDVEVPLVAGTSPLHLFHPVPSLGGSISLRGLTALCPSVW